MRRQPHRSQSGITLIELLVSIIVMGILSSMIIGTWISLSNAYSFNSHSNKQRDLARQAISRMSREIRDAQAPWTGVTRTAFKLVKSDQIQFYSTFNAVGAPDPSTRPQLTRFILRGGTIYREKPGPNGVFDRGVDVGVDDVSTPLVGYVVNDPESVSKDLFTYHYYDLSGLVSSNSTDSTHPLVPLPSPGVVQAVGLNLYVDENPGRSPNYMDLNTTVKPRNVSQF